MSPGTGTRRSMASIFHCSIQDSERRYMRRIVEGPADQKAWLDNPIIERFPGKVNRRQKRRRRQGNNEMTKLELSASRECSEGVAQVNKNLLGTSKIPTDASGTTILPGGSAWFSSQENGLGIDV